MSREALIASTLVELADTLVDDFDIVDILVVLSERCLDTLDASAAGIMLAAPGGDLRVVAASSDTMHVLETFELQAEEGPCLDCYRSGAAVVNEDLARSGHPWPRFAPVALEAGFRSVAAFPMRLRGASIGALNLFRESTGQLDDADALVAQAFADVATIAVLQHRAAQKAQVLNDQLQNALNSRISIEQAKGVLAERVGLDVGEAFVRLREYARSHNRRLADVAHDLVVGNLLDDPLFDSNDL